MDPANIASEKSRRSSKVGPSSGGPRRPLVRAKDIFNEDELKHLRSKSDLKAAWMFIHCWGVVFGLMALFAIWPNPLTFITALMGIGARQLGFAVLMHDAAHGLLFNNIKWNDRITQWFAAYPVATDIRSYRHYHLAHHSRTQQPDDPDIVLSAPFPITKTSFKRKVLRDLTGQTGLKQRRAQIRAALGRPEWTVKERIPHFIDRFGGALLSNVILFGGLAAVGHWYLYPLLWLLPLLTWFQFITRIRNITEHAVVPDNDDDFKNARTTIINPVMRFFVAPYWVNYHVEHHLFTFVPCYRLPEAHEMLREKGYHERMEIRHGYRDVLSQATSKSEAAAA